LPAIPASGGRTAPTAKRTRFGATLVPVTADPTGAPRSYAGDLTPSFSEHRPKVRCDQRLECWTSPYTWKTRESDGSLYPELASTLDRGIKVRAHSIVLSTRSTYGSAILIYIVWTDLRSIPEHERFPTSTFLVCSWVADLAGSYSEGTVSTYVAALHVWHDVQAVPWRVDANILSRTITGCRHFKPPASKRAKRAPYTPDILCAILAHLDLLQPLDAAVWAVCCVAFFGQARLGELIVKSGSYSPLTHPNRLALTQITTKFGDHVSVCTRLISPPLTRVQASQLRLPRTKLVYEGGELIHWGKQLSERCDPDTAIANHFRVNSGAADDDHFFAYVTHPKKRKADKNAPAPVYAPLTGAVFTKTINAAAKKAKITLPPSHAFRIGGTTEYLLRGTPFAVVQYLGRWQGPSFALYLREHAEVMAPYLGERDPDALDRMTRYLEIPPVR
jgi:hypothetical protein